MIGVYFDVNPHPNLSQRPAEIVQIIFLASVYSPNTIKTNPTQFFRHLSKENVNDNVDISFSTQSVTVKKSSWGVTQRALVRSDGEDTQSGFTSGGLDPSALDPVQVISVNASVVGRFHQLRLVPL